MIGTNLIRMPTVPQQITIITKKEGDKERSADSKLGEDIYNGVLACSHILMAAMCPEIYIPAALAGCAYKLASEHYGFSKVTPETKTHWEKKSETFGDSSWYSQVLNSATDLALLKVTFVFHIAYPFVAFKAGMMGADLTTRSIKFLSSIKKDQQN